jgi:hypothetical protein
MKQLYTRSSTLKITLIILSVALFHSSCKKDFIDLGFGTPPTVRITVPLINHVVDFSRFNVDTTAYGNIRAISIPMISTPAISIPINDLLNRNLQTSVQTTSEALSVARGKISKRHITTVDTLIANIQNSTLSTLFSQAIIAGTIPPSISQSTFKNYLISIGNNGDSYKSTNSLNTRIEFTNYQNAIISCVFKIKTANDSSFSPLTIIPQGGIHSLTLSLGKEDQLPLTLSLTSFSFTPIGTINSNSPLFDLKILMDEEFIRFESQLDTVFWTKNLTDFDYSDSLSHLSARSEIKLNTNTNFLFSTNSNLPTPLRRTIRNNAYLLVDIPAPSGQTSQYSVANKTIFGSNDTFSYESSFYSLNTNIPWSLNSYFISTTDVHSFPKPKSSKIILKNNVNIKVPEFTLSNFNIPFIDSALFFDPILDINVSSDLPLELQLSLNGTNFPHGAFYTDTIFQKLAVFNNTYFRHSFSFDSSNSFLSTLCKIPADSINLNNSITLIGNGNNYIVKDDSNIELTSNLLLPLNGQFNGFTFKDSVNVNFDSTLIHYALSDTLRFDFASINNSTMGATLRIQLKNSSGTILDDQSVKMFEPVSYDMNTSSNPTTNNNYSSFSLLKDKILNSKYLIYTIEVNGDDENRFFIPTGDIHLEASLVIP